MPVMRALRVTLAILILIPVTALALVVSPIFLVVRWALRTVGFYPSAPAKEKPFEAPDWEVGP